MFVEDYPELTDGYRELYNLGLRHNVSYRIQPDGFPAYVSDHVDLPGKCPIIFTSQK